MACSVLLWYDRPSSVPTTDLMPEVGSTAWNVTRTSWLSPYSCPSARPPMSNVGFVASMVRTADLMVSTLPAASVAR
jgi:hypothetical protein